MRGRATLRQALVFITNHQAEPQTWTSERISDEYKLKPNVVGTFKLSASDVVILPI